MKSFPKLLILVLASLLLLSACGQKGDLYLPETESEAESETETTE